MDRIRISVPFWTMQWAPVYIAVEKGFFENEGIKAEVVTRPFGKSETKALTTTNEPINMVLRGDTEFMVQLSTAIEAISKGADLKLVCGVFNRNPHRIVAKPGIESMKDLKGKTLLTKVKDSLSDYEAVFLLKKHGFDLEKDVNLIDLPGGKGSGLFLEDATLAALLSGKVDAISCSAPKWCIAERRGYKVIGDLGDFIHPYLAHGLITRGQFLKEAPETVKKTVRAVVAAHDFLQKNREESMKVMMKEIKDLEWEDALYTYDRIREFWTPEVNIDAVRNTIKFITAASNLQEFPPEKLVG